MAFVITDGTNNYIRAKSDGSFDIVSDIFQATRFKFEKANNYLNISMKNNPDAKKWSVIRMDNIESMDLDEIRMIQEELYKNLKLYSFKLNSDLSDVDQEITDIEHYIEFFDFNAAQGYNAYRMLHERLSKRRKIKNDQYKASMLLGTTPNDFINGNVEKAFVGCDSRQYTPRILKELFEND